MCLYPFSLKTSSDTIDTTHKLANVTAMVNTSPFCITTPCVVEPKLSTTKKLTCVYAIFTSQYLLLLSKRVSNAIIFVAELSTEMPTTEMPTNEMPQRHVNV